MQGITINGFTLQRLLGTGGMAEVWYAESKIGMKAAVKILSEELSHNAQMQDRFFNEAKVMVQLDHPNIRKVYGFDEIDGRPAIVMEYLEGTDLKSRLKRGQRFTQEELVKWWNQLVDALNYTHQKGIVHRDIKPGNIFVDREGNIKLLDFGIAKVRESISSTQTGQKLGTLMYMSPEQVRDSKHIDYRTDVYSLAVTFVHLITGKKPYDSDTTSDFEISEQIVYKPLDLSGLPEMWQSFLAPYLNKAPEQRPELCHFKNTSTPAYRAESDDEGTMVSDAPTKPMPKKVEPKHETQSEPSEKPKSKKGLWIGLGVVAAVAVLLVLLLKPKKEELVVVDTDTEAYQACQTIEDYRAYIRDYGRNAIHYSEAKQYIDKYVADSIQQAQQALAEAKAKEQAEKDAAEKIEAEQKAQEAEKKEDAAYKKCTTISGCNAYLKNYPNGRYVEEVKSKKAQLEEVQQEPEVTESRPAVSYPVYSGPKGDLACVYFFGKDTYNLSYRKKYNNEADYVILERLGEGYHDFRVIAYIVPGEMEGHERELANNRANATAKQIQKLAKKTNINVEVITSGMEMAKIMAIIRESGIHDKDAILYQINNSNNKEKMLSELIGIYPQLESDILPQFRRVEVYVY